MLQCLQDSSRAVPPVQLRLQWSSNATTLDFAAGRRQRDHLGIIVQLLRRSSPLPRKEKDKEKNTRFCSPHAEFFLPRRQQRDAVDHRGGVPRRDPRCGFLSGGFHELYPERIRRRHRAAALPGKHLVSFRIFAPLSDDHMRRDAVCRPVGGGTLAAKPGLCTTARQGSCLVQVPAFSFRAWCTETRLDRNCLLGGCQPAARHHIGFRASSCRRRVVGHSPRPVPPAVKTPVTAHHHRTEAPCRSASPRNGRPGPSSLSCLLAR